MTDSPLDPEAVRIGATIRALRGTLGWTLGELAKAVDKSHSYISNIEYGRKKCPSPLAVDLAAQLGVPLAAIVSPGYQYEPPATTETDGPFDTPGQ
jgi:transcriptional regulator with XRE-family HTH domain